MATGSAQITVGTSPTLLASVPAGLTAGPAGFVLLYPDATADVFLGGSNVSTTNGLKLLHGLTTPQPVTLQRGDSLYGVVATGSGTVGVLQT